MRPVPLFLGLALLAAWLLLNGLSAAQLIFGAALALLLIGASASVRPRPPRVRRLYEAVPLAAMVFLDIVRSNAHVAKVAALAVRGSDVRSGFVNIPLEVREPHALAILAMIVTATPGTIWAGLSPDGGTLRLHVLDLQDEAVLIRTVKERYERPLRRIFE
jgi:multicomponent K+:H+ antiporter subunit E